MQWTTCYWKLSDIEIQAIATKRLALLHPCHNQAVERHIKLVAEASASVAGYERHNKSIKRKIKSRKIMNEFNTKRQFRS